MTDRGEAREPEEPPLGRYANYFEVGHNAFEFVLDFGQFYPESDRARVHTRIITGPIYAEALLRTLQEALARYRDTFGGSPT
jgi:hypothetical protein